MTDNTFVEATDHTTNVITAWVILVALTLASYWFRDHGLSAEMAVIAIIAIAFVKVYMVGMSFMELNTAPLLLRNIFVIWCLASCAGLIAAALIL